MRFEVSTADVIVVGAGHAGIEAALSSASWNEDHLFYNNP